MSRTVHFGRASSTDPTLESIPLVEVRNKEFSGSLDGSCDSDCAKPALVEGSGPGLSGETASLLRYRLCVVAMLFFGAFAVFLVKVLASVTLDTAYARFLVGFHAFTTVALLGSALWLYQARAASTHWLRIHELIIFGLPCAFFVVKDYFYLQKVPHDGLVESPTAAWMVFMFTYAMFIPNSWRRAAIVLGCMAVAPLLLMATAREAIPWGDVVGIALTMSIAAAISISGVHIIGTLRREAFAARQLGQYRLRRLIGSGGMGEVYLAEHKMMKRPVAIKLIRPGKANDPNILARFEREVRATARLSHWNTIEIFDYGSTACGSFYYVMEFLPGLSLADLVKQYGPLPANRVVHLLRQACDGLRKAHAIGLIHRDLKPANIFAAQRGGVYDVTKVLDFGLAKPLTDVDSTQLTQEGSITGSPLYMSPEQATGDSEPDARSDIYSLGAVGYYLLTGRPPFEGENPIKILLAHAREQITPLSQLRPDVPADLEQVITRALSKSPADRFADAATLEAALAECESADRWSRDAAAQWWQTNGVSAASQEEPAMAY